MAEMALHTERLHGPTTAEPERRDRSEFRLIFMVAFIFFLVEAVVSLLLPKTWRRDPSRHFNLRSIVAEARETADMSFALSLMR